MSETRWTIFCGDHFEWDIGPIQNERDSLIGGDFESREAALEDAIRRLSTVIARATRRRSLLRRQLGRLRRRNGAGRAALTERQDA